VIDSALAPDIRTAAAIRRVRTRKVSIVKFFMRSVLTSVFLWVRKSLDLERASNMERSILRDEGGKAARKAACIAVSFGV
jgi:hypothetical protein